MPVNLPTQLLRSFVAIVDTGTMLNAAERVFVSQSALSLQIKRLEELVQQALFVRDGRRLALTPAGETLLDYARRILRVHDEALRAVNGDAASGPIRVGMVQDFAETLLTGVLARFAGLHPDGRISARVAGTAELRGLIERDELDMLFGYGGADDPTALSVVPTRWFGDEALTAREEVPLALLETPCRFREMATAALDAAGVRWRVAVETPNLSTLRAAVEAGLGVTCRTAFFVPGAAPLAVLPALPDVACIVVRAPELAPDKERLANLAAETIRAL